MRLGLARRLAWRARFDFAMDLVGVGEDEGVLDSSQAAALSRMIAAYESR